VCLATDHFPIEFCFVQRFSQRKCITDSAQPLFTARIILWPLAMKHHASGEFRPLPTQCYGGLNDE
ncbi:hypothetical protein, partial [Paraglaciecola mesophila]|uniref:hypothetical protein n=1 Tax=Paraglaciecola mesophila TaxID=197222 RepID=UPI001D0479B8